MPQNDQKSELWYFPLTTGFYMLEEPPEHIIFSMIGPLIHSDKVSLKIRIFLHQKKKSDTFLYTSEITIFNIDVG